MKAPTMTAIEAMATANLYLLDHVPDRLTADQPRFDEKAHVWRVPVILTYPTFGVLGQVGQVVVSAVNEDILSATPAAEMLAAAHLLVEPYRDAIEAAVP